jgi:hypothetical protein
MRQILFLLALVLAAPALAAEGVYRSVMPDGQIVYGSKPEPGAKESSQMNLPPPNISAPTPRAPPPPPPPKGSSDTDIRSARQALDDAKKALEDGREPLESERIGVASKGSSRLTDAYYQRIKGLESAVTAAQARLDAAQRGGR